MPLRKTQPHIEVAYYRHGPRESIEQSPAWIRIDSGRSQACPSSRWSRRCGEITARSTELSNQLGPPEAARAHLLRFNLIATPVSTGIVVHTPLFEN